MTGKWETSQNLPALELSRPNLPGIRLSLTVEGKEGLTKVHAFVRMFGNCPA